MPIIQLVRTTSWIILSDGHWVFFELYCKIFRIYNRPLYLRYFFRKLSLSTNMIEKITGISSLKNLKVLCLARNYIKTLGGLVSTSFAIFRGGNKRIWFRNSIHSTWFLWDPVQNAYMRAVLFWSKLGRRFVRVLIKVRMLNNIALVFRLLFPGTSQWNFRATLDIIQFNRKNSWNWKFTKTKSFVH